jgi:hypothetical protein
VKLKPSNSNSKNFSILKNGPKTAVFPTISMLIEFLECNNTFGRVPNNYTLYYDSQSVVVTLFREWASKVGIFLKGFTK